MALQRFAVTAILICIGILLLSACGLPLGPPARVRPVVLPGRFDLYAPDHSVVGSGTLDSATDASSLTATLTVYAPECPHGLSFDLAGRTFPSLLLRSSSDRTPQVTLRSSTAPVFQPYAIGLFPFSGHLLLTGSCGEHDIPVQAILLVRP